MLGDEPKISRREALGRLRGVGVVAAAVWVAPAVIAETAAPAAAASGGHGSHGGHGGGPHGHNH